MLIRGIKMKFMHVADVHLGSPFRGLKNIPERLRKVVVNSTKSAFAKLVQTAIEQRVDFVCIVGDLFDNPSPDIDTLSFAVDQLDILNQAKIPVFLSYGNHDYLNAKIPTTIFPENVTIFGPEVETKKLTTTDGTIVGLTGFSYAKRAEVTSRIEEYPTNDGQFDFQIGLLHGSMDGLHASEARYAPFTLSQLLDKNYDYWALGHIHKRQILHEDPVIAYAGNTQGRHINEPGAKGASLVTLKPNQKAKVEFVRSDVVEWQSLTVAVEEGADFQSVLGNILQKANTITSPSFKLMSVSLAGSNHLAPEVLEELSNGLGLSQLQKQLDSAEEWVYRILLKVDEQTPVFSELDRTYWQQAAEQVFTPKTVQKQLGRLMELDFIAEAYQADFNPEELRERVKIMLQQRNALGDD